MTKIGIISDTHSHLEESVFRYFEDCDEIWHAGDVGDVSVIEKLENFKPLKVVYGNIDGNEIRIRSKENWAFTIEGFKVLMTHIAGKPPTYNPRVRALIKEHDPDILICGHSHILKAMKDNKNNLLFINPGAAGQHGFHRVKTLIRFSLDKRKIENMEVIELGKRSRV